MNPSAPPPSRRVRIFGILNLTADSFSDGGRFLDPGVAIEHAHKMIAGGANVIDVGAESTHPAAARISAADEISRLTPVIAKLCHDGISVSVDTTKPEVMRRALDLGASCINDVRGFDSPESVAAVADRRCELVVMHALRRDGSEDARAQRAPGDADTIVARLQAFFRERLAQFADAGIAPERVILDPGMGYFLGASAAASLNVLRDLAALREFGRPLMVSISRKSPIGEILADAGPRPVSGRGAGSLAAELWCVQAGVDCIRTHDPSALRDAERVWRAISP
jgi:dihydropteroate synthase type 2